MKEKPTYEELERRVQELESIESELKHLKKEGRESENFFKSLYEKAPLGYQSLDENGHFLIVNQAWLDTLGYTQEEVVGKSFADFLHPDWRDHFKENFPKFKAIGEILGVEFEMVKKNGDLILVSFNGKISRDEKGNFQQTHCILNDITERRRQEEELKKIEWMLTGKPSAKYSEALGYGDLTELNRDGLISRSIDYETLRVISSEYLDLLESSSAIYEKNGDYAFGIFCSGWCRLMDRASRNLCRTEDNEAALASGKWLCHESCWTDCSKLAIESQSPADIECKGGIHIYAVPIFSAGEVIGAINFGYGDPPKDPAKLRSLADSYGLDPEKLAHEADAYASRPSFIIELAKQRLLSSARLIGIMVERKRAEESLREQRDFSESLVETAQVIILVLDTQGCIVRFNPYMEKLAGYDLDEVKGKDWFETFLTPEIDRTIKPLFQQTVADIHTSGNVNSIIAKDGRTILVEWFNKTLKGKDGRIMGVLAIGQDITERKQVDNLLAFLAQSNFNPASGDFFQLLARYISETLGMGFVCIDRLDGDNLTAHTVAVYSDGKFQDNVSYALKDTPCGEVVGKQVCCFPASIKNLFPSDAVLQQMEAESYIGVTLWSNDGRPIGLIAVIGAQPIKNRAQAELILRLVAVRASGELERKQAEDALLESEQFLQILMESLPLPVFYKDVEGLYKGCNKAFETFSGRSRLELIGRSVFDINPPELAKIFHAKDSELFNKITKQTYESQVKNAYGELRDVLFHKATLTNASGAISGIIGVITDITERKRAEEALEKRLVALTQPLDNPEGISFEDLFVPADIQRLQDEFALATGVASIITRPDGTPLTVPSNFCRLCSDLIRKTEMGLANCLKSDAAWGRPRQDGPTIQPCLSGGLWDAGAAISVGGHHVANWLIGQVRDAEQTEEKMRDYARKIGADETAVAEAFQEVPAMSHERFEKIARMLFTLANQLSAAAYQNVQQARFITERKGAEEALRESENQISSIFRSAPIGIGSVVNRVLTKVNKRLCEMTGYDETDLIGQSARMLYLSDEDFAFVGREKYAQIADNGTGTVETRWQKHDGTIMDVLLSSTPVNLQHLSKGVTFTALDITERKGAEKKLQESEKRFKALHNASFGGIAIHDHGVILECNQGLSGISGFGYDELIGMDGLLLIAEQSREAVMTNIRSGYEEPYEAFGVRKNGEEYPLRLEARNIPYKGAMVRVVEFRDITEPKKAEESLRESELTFRKLFEDSADAILLIDKTGVFVECNQAALTLLKMTREQFLFKTPVSISPEYQPDGQRSRDKALKMIEIAYEKALHRFDWTSVNSENVEFIVEVSLMPIKFKGELMLYTAWRDITERKRVEEELARQQRSIHLNSRIASVFLTSSPSEVFADVLDVFRTALDSRFGYFGYINEAGDLVSQSLTRGVWDHCQMTEKSIVFPRASWGGLWGRSLIEKQTVIANENLQVPEGHVPLENALATPIVYNDNLIGQVVLANKAGGYDNDDRDLLESAAAQTAPILFAIREEARQKISHEKLEEQLRQSQKMEAVGRLAGGVAHDFNNMLGVIIGLADIILMKMAPDNPYHGHLTEIRKAGERSADLTRKLLAFARKQTVAPKVLDFNDTIESMLTLLRRLIGEDIDLLWKPGQGVWPVKMDPAQIDQILANLCVNARDAIVGVGKVTIETDKASFDEDYCTRHLGFVPGDFVLLAVSDNGCGMDTETISHLFEPFFTTKELGKGTGLGLATVYGAVKQNNGFINVYSEPGQGTTFKIYLPRHAAKVLAETKEPNSQAPERGSETILLVEDEPAILRMTTMMLEMLGYTVLAASTPGEALSLAQEHAGGIDLVLTDVVMPEMNGRDLAKNLLSIYPDMRRLFMSGYTANVIAHHGVLDEGVHFMQKPFSMEDLKAKLRDVLQG